MPVKRLIGVHVKALIAKFSLLALVLICYGCATPANQNAMTIARGDVAPKANENLKNSIAVNNVTGGKSTNPLWTSQIDNAGFKTALEQSLSIVGYKATSAANAKYVLDVELKSVDQPLVGIDFSVTTTVVYSVSKNGEKKTFPVTATGVAKFSEHWVGGERLRVANEKSVKENIGQFINKITEEY
jgi:hypothetical protein